jgi:transcriptional regulator of NAD metabolism
MDKPIIRIHNAETDEIIDREMNAAEFKQYQKDQDAIAESILTAQAENETKAKERQLILDKLGLTADEARLLLG